MKPRSLLPLLFLASLTAACTPKRQSTTPAVTTESAAEEILRIASTWTSSVPEQGFFSPPSPISLFKKNRTSELVLTHSSAHETLIIDEKIQLRDGNEIHCSTRIESELTLRYGRRKGEAAIELARPPISAERNCDNAHPEGRIEEESRRALFVLRADVLISIEPPLEKRRYIPGTE